MSGRAHLNVAADQLIVALEDTTSLLGIRAGLAPMIALAEAFTSQDDPMEKEARELLRVWLAFDDLVAAVADRRSESVGVTS